MFWLGKEIMFPTYESVSEDGIIALGGDLTVDRLVYAYERGIFPWYNEGEPIVWYSPIKRMVLFPSEVKISKSMQQILKKGDFIITENKAFAEVIFNCRYINRADQYGTWITNDMEKAYIDMHRKGYAKSIEVWRDRKIVGGLYGVDLGRGVFCGESMFSKESNMSKLAFIHLASNCGYKLIDCQVHNNHLESLGAREIDRSEFLKYL